MNDSGGGSEATTKVKEAVTLNKNAIMHLNKVICL